ncbi:hypothetical protein, partial [Rhodovulum sp. PH10]|uniref:hypothetical protein n=1 Tax=Rhodovulum sp. PH10 TaxID=1187851 RepID=UPI001ED96DE7
MSSVRVVLRALSGPSGPAGDAAPVGRSRAFARALLVGCAITAGMIPPGPGGPPVAIAAPAPISADLSVATNEGYARLLFQFETDVEASAKLANSILIISFSHPVSVSVERLAAQAPGYVAAARRDPDGRGVRIALSRKVRLNAMQAAERFYVDLLPDTWAGAPPPLPREVVEDLARRARDAERKVRRQQQLVRQQELALTRVRVSNQPTFSRYTFDLPDLIPVSTSRETDSLTLTFDQPLRFDLADVKSTLPPMVAGVESKVEGQSTVVRFGFIGTVDVRTFREDTSYVVDVGGAEAGKRRNNSADLAGRAAEIASLLAPDDLPSRPPGAR